MTEQRRAADAPLSGPDLEGQEKLRQLLGERQLGEQSGAIDASDLDDLGSISATDRYEGEVEAGMSADLPDDPESLDLLTELELRADETDNPDEAAEEGMTYIPPIDPPFRIGDDPQGAEIASGFGVSSLDEPYDADHQSSGLPEDDDVTARVRQALRADSSTTGIADQLLIEVEGSVVTIGGLVDDLDDNDNVLAVAEFVAGVSEVVDRMQVRTLE